MLKVGKRFLLLSVIILATSSLSFDVGLKQQVNFKNILSNKLLLHCLRYINFIQFFPFHTETAKPKRLSHLDKNAGE